MRLLGWMLPGPAEAILPPPTNPDFRVLFIRYERIGDMIMATSLIRTIAKVLPGGKVDVLANPATAPVLEGNPHVGNVLVLDRKSVHSYRQLMKRLRKERYTVMVDGRINNPPIFTSTPLLMYAGRVRYRVGAGGDSKPRIYNVSVPEWNRVEHYIEGSKELAVPFGVNPEAVDWQPEIFLSRTTHARGGALEGSRGMSGRPGRCAGQCEATAGESFGVRASGGGRMESSSRRCARRASVLRTCL